MPQQDLNESARELRELKELFDSTKNDKARIEGRIESLQEQLERRGLKTPIQAKKTIRRLKTEVEDMGTELFDKVNEIQRKMPDGSTS
jgi:predicted  nucleic acid-binding Zn-ribbon protein